MPIKWVIRCAATVVLAATGGVQPAFAQRLTCFPVQPGDTASRLALRLTGDAAHRHAPWFQILEPSSARFVPKAHYGRILPGWHACVAQWRVRESVTFQQPLEEAPPSQPPPAGLVGRLTNTGWVGIWIGACLLLAIIVAWHIAATYSSQRRALVTRMTHFGERFVREFEQPLMKPGSNDRALASRLRLKPGRGRLDILLAPRGRRTYPNLSDHRKNVEYDVGRVLQLLKDEPFVVERLSEQGRCVIVQCRFRSI